MESIEIDIKMWMRWAGREGAGEKKEKSRPKVTHIRPLTGGRLSKQCFSLGQVPAEH